MTPQEKEQYLAKWMPKLQQRGALARYPVIPPKQGPNISQKLLDMRRRIAKIGATTKEVAYRDRIANKFNERRALILSLVIAGKHTVSDICEAAGMTRSVVHGTLGRMTENGDLVREVIYAERRHGGNSFHKYKIADPHQG